MNKIVHELTICCSRDCSWTVVQELLMNWRTTFHRGEEMLITGIFSFPRNVFISVKGRLNSLSHLICHLQNAFSFDMSKTLICCTGLTLYHTISTFNNHETKVFWKHCEKKEKMLVTSIFSFLHNVFYPSQVKFYFFSHIYFIRGKCFELDQPRN